MNFFLTLTTTIIGALAAIREIFGDMDMMEFDIGFGGLLETVALVNSVILAALCGLFAFYRLEWRGWNFWLAPIFGFISAWIAQFVYTKLRYDAKKPESEDIHFPSQKE